MWGTELQGTAGALCLSALPTCSAPAAHSRTAARPGAPGPAPSSQLAGALKTTGFGILRGAFRFPSEADFGPCTIELLCSSSSNHRTLLQRSCGRFSCRRGAALWSWHGSRLQQSLFISVSAKSERTLFPPFYSVVSPIDGKSMESITSVKIFHGSEYKANGKVIRWTEVSQSNGAACQPTPGIRGLQERLSILSSNLFVW